MEKGGESGHHTNADSSVLAGGRPTSYNNNAKVTTQDWCATEKKQRNELALAVGSSLSIPGACTSWIDYLIRFDTTSTDSQ